MSRPPVKERDYVTPGCLIVAGAFLFAWGLTGPFYTEHPDMGYAVEAIIGILAAGLGVYLLWRPCRRPRRPKRPKRGSKW